MKALVVTLLVVCGVASAQPMPLVPGAFTAGPVEAEAPDIDVLTFGVGDRIFEKFGHTAICLRYHDPQLFPVCFNYGVTDFDAGPALIWSFLRGTQEFWVEPESFEELVEFYTWEDRDIWVQTLPLEAPARRSIETALWRSYEPVNRFYVYDHFFDNCTTRVRDLLDRATGGALRTGGDEPYPLTFRELGARGLASAEPLVGLADFVLGRQLDDRPSRWGAMFHPDILRVTLKDELGAEPRLIYKRAGPPFALSGGTGRWLFLVLAAVFSLPLLAARWRRRYERAALAWAVLYPGLWGLVLWVLVILSSIPGLRWNEAALVLVPLDLALPLLDEGRRYRYARARVVLLLAISILCGLGILKQPLWIPILTAIVPNAILLWRRR
jgi:hypothetical protein